MKTSARNRSDSKECPTIRPKTAPTISITEPLNGNGNDVTDVDPTLFTPAKPHRVYGDYTNGSYELRGNDIFLINTSSPIGAGLNLAMQSDVEILANQIESAANNIPCQHVNKNSDDWEYRCNDSNQVDVFPLSSTVQHNYLSVAAFFENPNDPTDVIAIIYINQQWDPDSTPSDCPYHAK